MGNVRRRISAMDGTITSRANARVKILRAALEGRRKAGEPVAIEGPHLIGEALRSGLALESVFVREDAVRLLDELGVDSSSRVTVLSGDVFASVSATESAQGVAALVVSPVATLPEKKDRLLLVLVGLQDPGNMGTLVRSAEAFGADAVVVTPGTVDAWNQKAMRASAGSVFRVPVVQMELEKLRAMGVRLIAAVARDGGAPEDVDLGGDCGLMIGNEGAGLSEVQIAMADARVTIPCPGKVESLNAAVAGSLLLYAASRQRSVR